jgi:tetratricopeptide (TPR) repeat protein
MDDDPAEARALSERSLAIGEKVFGPDHVRLTGSLLSLGQFYNADGNHEKAASMFARAVEIREATFGPEHTSVTMPLIGLAGARAEMGDMEEASALLERAIEIASKDDRAEPLAQAKFAKAKLMWLDEDARPAALALAEEARGGLPADHDNRIPIDEWLEDRRAGL